jgi:hypothetical protein
MQDVGCTICVLQIWILNEVKAKDKNSKRKCKKQEVLAVKAVNLLLFLYPV